MRGLLARGFHDFRRRQADAFVDHLDAGIARPHCDLLCAVGVAVEPRLAEHEFEPPAELTRYPLDLSTQIVETDGFVARRAPDAGGRAVLAKTFAQGIAPFTRCPAGFCADDRGRHDVAILACSGA